MDDSGGEDSYADTEFMTWHAYHAGGLRLRLKIRYRDGDEMPDWRDGPDLFEAFKQAAAEGWHVYDRESGSLPGEQAVYYMMRRCPPSLPSC